MKRVVIGLTVSVLATMLMAVSAYAGALAFDVAGNLYAADPSKHSVFKYMPDGTKSSFSTEVRYPLGLCFDHEGNLFVSDGAATDEKNRRSILKFTPDGKRSTFATEISSVGMACDRSGNLVVSQGDSIFKFTPEGKKSTFVTSKHANFIDLAFDEAGNLFVVDQGWPVSIVKVTPDGAKSTFVTGVENPGGITVDATGNVFVSGTGAIFRFTPDGTKSNFSSAPNADRAWDLAVDRSGNVFMRNGHDAVLKFDPSGTPIAFTSEGVSPDKRWEYKCDEYGFGNCYPEIVKAGTTERVVDLDQELSVTGSESSDAQILWAPDSKRFAFNYSPPHAHHTRFTTVAFYQLRGDKWVALRNPQDYFLRRRPDYLPKDFNPRQCIRDWDELKLREWTDANTAILYAPCHGRSSDLKAAFLFTLKFDDANDWKIIKAHQMSKKELEEQQ